MSDAPNIINSQVISSPELWFCPSLSLSAHNLSVSLPPLVQVLSVSLSPMGQSLAVSLAQLLWCVCSGTDPSASYDESKANQLHKTRQEEEEEDEWRDSENEIATIATKNKNERRRRRRRRRRRCRRYKVPKKKKKKRTTSKFSPHRPMVSLYLARNSSALNDFILFVWSGTLGT